MKSWKFAVLIAAALDGVTPAFGQQDILKEITDTAEKLCVDVAQKGTTSSAEVKGDVTAELSGLARRLANLGVSGTGTLEESQYEGVVQAQLADTLKDVRRCKEGIFDTLQRKLLPEPSPGQSSRNPNELYQYGEPVADVQGAFINQANGFVTFQMIHTAGKADPKREVEYQDWVLDCPQLPAPPPNIMAGIFSGVTAGAKCTIVRKRQ